MENRRYKWYIIGVIIILIIIGIVFKLYINKNLKIPNENITSIKELAKYSKNNEDEEDIERDETKDIETMSAENKISPNAIIIEKTYYKICGHLIKNEKNVTNDLINKNEEELKKIYDTWDIESYSPLEIILYKESNDICEEHYVVKEHGRVVAIYRENKEGIQEFLEDTGIETRYLPEKDQENFKVGVKIIGKIKLNEFLEDYE